MRAQPLPESSAGDGGLEPVGGRHLERGGAVAGATPKVVQAAQFATLLQAASKTGPVGDNDQTRVPPNTVADRAVIRAFLTSGMAVSDELCSDWFRKLGAAQAEVDFTRDLASNLGTLSAVLLGVTGASTKAVSVVAGVTGATVKAIDSASANFIVAPDIGLVQRGIGVLRTLKTEELLKAAPQMDFYQAFSALTAYDNLCTHNEVKRFVNTALIRTNDRNSPESETFTLLSGRVIPKLESIFAAGAVVNRDSVAALWALTFYAGPVPAAAKKALLATLKAAKMYDGDKPLLRDKASGPAQLRVALYELNAGSDLDRLAAEAVAGADKPGPAGAAAPSAGMLGLRPSAATELGLSLGSLPAPRIGDGAPGSDSLSRQGVVTKFGATLR